MCKQRTCQGFPQLRRFVNKEGMNNSFINKKEFTRVNRNIAFNQKDLHVARWTDGRTEQPRGWCRFTAVVMLYINSPK